MERALSNRFIHGVLETVTTPIQDWLNAHPLWYWLVTHPLWLLGLLLVSILLVAGLFGAISRLTENIWLSLLRSPFQIIHWLWKTSTQFILRPPKPQKQPSLSPEHLTQQRLTDLLNRLEALKVEQDELLNEVKQIIHKR